MSNDKLLSAEPFQPAIIYIVDCVLFFPSVLNTGRSHISTQLENTSVILRVQTEFSLNSIISFEVLFLFLKCFVGHRDWPAGHHLHWPHRRCHEFVSEPGLQDLRVRSLRRHLQAVGHS